MSKNRPSGLCPLCGSFRAFLHREHIKPRWQGGTDDESNIQYICANCHEDKTYDEMQSGAWRAHCQITHTGIKRSLETKARMSQARAAWWSRREHTRRVYQPVAKDRRRRAIPYIERFKQIFAKRLYFELRREGISI